MKSKSPTSWNLLTESYLYTAGLLADEVKKLITDGLLKDKTTSNFIHLIPLIFSSIYNTRHGIELLLKTLIVIQKNGEYPENVKATNTTKAIKYRSHDLNEIVKILEEGVDGLIPINSIPKMLDGINIEEDMALLKKIVNKYQEYDFNNFPTFINKDAFKNTDNMNAYFRFPDDKLLSEAVRFLFDEDFNSRADLTAYKKRNFIHLCNINKLTEEIKMDIQGILHLNTYFASNVASYVYKNK